MSCVGALHTQLVTLLSVPHEVLLFRHKVFKEYVKIAVGPDFIHTLPSFIVLAAMIIALWKNPPKMESVNLIIGKTAIFQAVQVLASWIIVNGVLWLWLIFQRILYCFVWSYWSYESEYRDTVIPWWQRVWSSYYPPPLQPPIFSAGFISWIFSMFVAIGVLGYATSPNRMQNVFAEMVLPARDFLNIAQYYLSWSTNRFKEMISFERTATTLDESEISSMCDDCRSDMSADVTNIPINRREVHPISYGTNWTPRPLFSGYKETQRKYQSKQIRTSATVTGGSTIHRDDDDDDDDDERKLSPRQLRHRRGCHTVVPSNSSDKSSGC